MKSVDLNINDLQRRRLLLALVQWHVLDHVQHKRKVESQHAVALLLGLIPLIFLVAMIVVRVIKKKEERRRKKESEKTISQ